MTTLNYIIDHFPRHDLTPSELDRVVELANENHKPGGLHGAKREEFEDLIDRLGAPVTAPRDPKP